MPQFQSFEVESAEGMLSVALAQPERGGGPWPALLLCHRLPGAPIDAAPLVADLATTAAEAECQLVQFDLAPGGDRAPSLTALIDQAHAVARELMTRDDPDTVGILGVGAGATVAAALARRLESVQRVALVNGVTAGALATHAGDEETTIIDASECAEGFVASLAHGRSAEDLAFHPRRVLLLHAADDPIHLATSREAYRDAIERVGHPVQFEIVARSSAAFDDDDVRRATLARLIDFFRDSRTWTTPDVVADDA